MKNISIKDYRTFLELLSGLVFWDNLLQTSNLAVLLIFHALFISGTHKVPGLKFVGGYCRSRDLVLQRAYCHKTNYAGNLLSLAAGKSIVTEVKPTGPKDET